MHQEGACFNLKSGDKILFFQKPNGEIVINNASVEAIYKAQGALKGVAEDIGVYKMYECCGLFRA